MDEMTTPVVNPNETHETEQPMASVDTSKPVLGGRDSSIDVMSLLKTSTSTEDTTPVKKKSALEMAREAKEATPKGLVANTQEMNEKNAPKAVANKTEADAMSEVDNYMKEQEAMIDASKKIVIQDAPKNAIEMASLMDSLENVAKTGDVHSDPSKDANPERFTETKITEDNSIRLKTDAEMEATPDTAITEDTQAPTDKTPEEIQKEQEDEEKKKIVTVLIDKTGLGGDFAFTEDEREKLYMANEIRLKEIEDVNLSTLTVRKADKSFIEEAKEYQFSSSQTMMTFPASRFRAEMAGLSFGEMGDISLNTASNENISFEQIRKKLTVIYNKMRNPSCGEFASFDDFLKKFAYVDMDLAVFGLVVSTFPDIDEIPLNCQNPKCKKSFNHRFSPRSLIRYEKCSDKFLEDVGLVVNTPAKDLPGLIETSPAQNYKYIKLPFSKFIIKLGIASAYDYLYTIVDNILGNKFEEEHPDDVNGVLQLSSILLSLIRGVMIPQPDGSYVEYTEFEDMIRAIYQIKPDEFKILTAILQKYNNVYTVPFELHDIVCPHCGAKTAVLPLDVNYLVFLKYQRLLSEELNIDSISPL